MTIDTPRLAIRADYDQFMTLAAAYLVELRELGSEIRPTSNSLSFWGDLFTMATTQPKSTIPGLEMVIVMIGDYGFSVAGSLGYPMSVVDTDFGKTAYGHGTYVRPDKRRMGLSRVLRDKMREELRRRGFETVIGGAHLRNSAGAASLKDSHFIWYQMVGYERL